MPRGMDCDAEKEPGVLKVDSTRMSSSVDVGHELAMTCHLSDAVGNCLVEVEHHVQHALALGCLQLETA